MPLPNKDDGATTEDDDEANDGAAVPSTSTTHEDRNTMLLNIYRYGAVGYMVCCSTLV